MNKDAIGVIRDEHRALSALLVSLQWLLRDVRERRTKPDFDVLRAILFYVYAFPERLHHPKESTLLFATLRGRSDEADRLIDQLEREHDAGEHEIARLNLALLEYEQLGESRLPAFADAVDRYVGNYLRHMDLEESRILPLAKRLISPDEWARIDRGFAENRDPLTGHAPSQEFRALFSKIARIAPAPIGFGDAHPATQPAR